MKLVPIGKLLQNKKGNPLTNSILYIEIGRLLNLPIMGINLPNHFIVGYLDSKKGNLNPKNYEFNKEDVARLLKVALLPCSMAEPASDSRSGLAPF